MCKIVLVDLYYLSSSNTTLVHRQFALIKNYHSPFKRKGNVDGAAKVKVSPITAEETCMSDLLHTDKYIITIRKRCTL